MSLAAPPPELQRAIDRSSRRYGVPPDVLTGIWRIESGSSYPNPYVNSLGYGGLFGTKAWNAPTQQQADLAAKILADNIRSHNGDLSAALYSYSGGGYTQVPGETTYGNVHAPSAVPGPDTSMYTAPPRPGGTQDVGLFSGIGGALGSFGSAWEQGWSDILGAGGVLGAFKGFLKAFLWLVNPDTWLRAGEFLAGFVLILLGLYYFGKGEAGESEVSIGDLLRSPSKLAGGAAHGVQRTGQRAASGSLVGRGARKAARVAR